MAAQFRVENLDSVPGPENDYPVEISAADYDQLRNALEVLDTLWFIEEFFDNLLQNAVDFETASGRIEAGQRAYISSFPDETDVEIRLLNRLFGNFLSSSRAFVDGVPARISRSSALGLKRDAFKQLLSSEFDAHFSYRLLEGLRNHTQHRGVAIHQSLTWLRNLSAADGTKTRVLVVTPQINRDILTADEKVNKKVRAEIARDCDHMIDLRPHLAGYVHCFGRVMEATRLLFAPEYDAAVEAHTSLLRRHMDDEWAFVIVSSQGDPDRRKTLMTGAHNLRRLRRIRLRNFGVEPPSN